MSKISHDMTEAPRDGRRILVRRRVRLFSFKKRRYEDCGESWIEAWWDGARWREWLGSKSTDSTDRVEAVAWSWVPE